MRKAGLFITFEGLQGWRKVPRLLTLHSRERSLDRAALETAGYDGKRIGARIRRLPLGAVKQALALAAEFPFHFASHSQKAGEWTRAAEPFDCVAYQAEPGLPRDQARVGAAAGSQTRMNARPRAFRRKVYAWFHEAARVRAVPGSAPAREMERSHV